VNRRLRDEGVRLWHSPRLVVRMGRSAGAWAFTRQRFVHGREYGRERGGRFGRVQCVVRAVAAPAVVLVLTLRAVGEVRRKGRVRRLLPALPLVMWFNGAWAAGEAAGHLSAMSRRGVSGDSPRT
jgi:hypothetical protein